MTEEERQEVIRNYEFFEWFGGNPYIIWENVKIHNAERERALDERFL